MVYECSTINNHILSSFIYLNTNDAKDPNVYNYLKTQIDIQNLIDYWITESFYDNRDFPHNNVSMYKSIASNPFWEK